MTSTKQEKLITLLKTSEKANMLQGLLLSVAEDGYKRKSSLLKDIERMLPLDLQTGLFSYFKTEKIDSNKKEELLAGIREITETIPQLPSLSLTIAIQPDFRLETFLFETISKLSENPLLIDIHYNPDIIGGAIIQSHGLYKDYSLKKMLANI